MFTGLVQALGAVRRVTPDGAGGARLAVAEGAIAPQLVLGESVAVNGCCLTVVSRVAESFEFDCGPETLARTNLGKLAPGSAVNLERALRVGDSIGGHFVSGHIDCQAILVEQAQQGEWQYLRFAVDEVYDELLVTKGSVAIDGVSLTLVDVAPGGFRVMLIPHTLSATTLGKISAGDSVNIEFDLLAKHVQKLVAKMRIAVKS